jgi:hypothetical protein
MAKGKKNVIHAIQKVIRIVPVVEEMAFRVLE